MQLNKTLFMGLLFVVASTQAQAIEQTRVLVEYGAVAGMVPQMIAMIRIP